MQATQADDSGWIAHDRSASQPGITYGERVEIEALDGTFEKMDAGRIDWSMVQRFRLVFQAKKAPVPASHLDVQVGGSHYKDLAIQPIEYIHANNIPFAEGNVIKYVTRWRTKAGIKDLEKARHFIDLLIELEKKVVQ